MNVIARSLIFVAKLIGFWLMLTVVFAILGSFSGYFSPDATPLTRNNLVLVRCAVGILAAIVLGPYTYCAVTVIGKLFKEQDLQFSKPSQESSTQTTNTYHCREHC